MGKSTPQVPTPPDPAETAAAQAAINKDTAITQANLNRVDEYTPYGSSTWSQQVGQEREATPASREPIYSADRVVPESSYDTGDGDWETTPGYTIPGGIIGYNDIPGIPGGVLPSDPNDPTQRWTRTTALDPAQKAIFDRETAVEGELNQVALEQVGRVRSSLNDPFSYEGIPDAGSTQGARDASGRIADISNTAYDYSGQPAAPSVQGITDSANIAAQSVNAPFSFSGQAPSTSGVANALAPHLA